MSNPLTASDGRCGEITKKEDLQLQLQNVLSTVQCTLE